MIRVHLRNELQVITDEYGDQPLEFGRSKEIHDGTVPVNRIFLQDKYASRHHARLEPQESGGLLLRNLSSRKPVVLADGEEILPGDCRTIDGNTVCFWVGKTWVEVESEATPHEVFATIASSESGSDGGSFRQRFESIETPTMEILTQWFDTLISVQRAAAGAADFYQQAAQAAVSLIGFEKALVLLQEDSNWVVKGQSSLYKDSPPKFSRSLLNQVVQERRTFYQSGEQLQSISDGGLAAASPIFDAKGEAIIGAVYGYRAIAGTGASCEVTPMDAQLLQTLASVVSLGIVRMQREEEASILRIKFDQFFSPALARELEKDPSLLEGRERQITVMFGDLRNFTRHATRLSPSETCQAITDVLECMTVAIRQTEGVVVDYAGDGIMAIWNAPRDQSNHAELAATSALNILRELPVVSKKWQDRLGLPFRIGIGINTGNALVGNTGTSYKFKYGASGQSVNLASRIESATKHIGVPILISQSTHELLNADFQTRRLLKIRVVGLDEAVGVYELHGDDPAGAWNERRDLYERALSQFEQKEWARSCQTIQPLLFARDEGIGDLPSLMLAGRAIDCLKSPPANFEAVIELADK